LGEQFPRQAVVSQTLAASYFGSDDPIGQQITIAMPRSGAGPREQVAFQIVGIVGDVRNQGPRDPVAPHVYLPGPALIGNPTILVRVSIEPTAVASALRNAIRTTDRYSIIGEPGTIEQILGAVVYAQPRFSLLVISLFAVAGTLLVAIGVFSVMAYTVSRQTREIAVRLALGAKRGDVMRLVLRFGGQLLLMGITVGILASVAAGQLLARQLWSVSAADPQTILAAVSVVTVVALLACYLPARRARHIDPMTALRLE
jgi:putative ABC transport system permease protein